MEWRIGGEYGNPVIGSGKAGQSMKAKSYQEAKRGNLIRRNETREPGEGIMSFDGLYTLNIKRQKRLDFQRKQRKRVLKLEDTACKRLANKFRLLNFLIGRPVLRELDETENIVRLE